MEIKRCRRCRKELDCEYTAHLMDHSSVGGLCYDCARKTEQDELNTIVGAAVKNLCDAANRMGNTEPLAQAIMHGMYRQHRELQSQFFKALHRFFELHSELEPGQYDARNEWTVKTAKRWEENSFDS